ncbi:response regulator transcription factor [Sporolactobacillus terrae]|uniref:response regulator transcription factor n=1 Tax=Sporolactobacillus terrae TaxID=269673 RepID=UPI00111B9724|nr:response regulator transcription factor [Sporolactobacillus terrae]
MTSILIIDDHKAVAAGTERILKEAGFDVQIFFSSNKLQEKLQQRHFDAIVLDWSIPGTDGLTTTKTIAEVIPEAKIIIYTGFEEELIPVYDELVGLGVSGIISKSSGVNTFVSSIYSILGGYVVFSYTILREIRQRRLLIKKTVEQFDEREREIIRNILDGKTNNQIGDLLHVSQRTVEVSVHKIYRKLNIHAREEVGQKVKELELILPK